MAKTQDHEQEYTFRNVELLKNETFGIGSYGSVCKAKCDQLICAAKLLYPVLFQMTAPDPVKEHSHPFRRFETECAFLSRINHPNIVQYLGTYYDPDTNAPVLLMELLDESLTHFLESSPGDIPYHIQVNLSYDIAQALAFLHSNGIIHRDLSSNNVLLIAGSRAKVADFGMSKFTDINVTQLVTMTTCPGTPAFMSPEALNEPPVYTEKLDNFSFGVLLVQITTRQFPKPTDRFEIRELVDPRFPNQAIRANVLVPEIKRRQAHISLIEYPLLLQIAHHCLKDKDVERPSSQQLCQTLSALKMTARYQESFQQDLNLIIRDNEDLQANLQLMAEKDDQIRAKDQQLHTKDAEIGQLALKLQASEEMIIHKNELARIKCIEIDQFATQLDQATKEFQTQKHKAKAMEKHLRRFNKEIQSCDENTASLRQTMDQRDREVTELRHTLASKNEEINDLSTRIHQVALQQAKDTSIKRVIIMRWESLPDAPVDIIYGSSAVVGDMAYFNYGESKNVYEFSNNEWQELPLCPNSDFTIVSVNNRLTTVGGRSDTQFFSNKVYSYISNKWVEHFPPMPTRRWRPGAVYANNTLLVAGGYFDSKKLTTVEIFNTANMQWSMVSSLPAPTTRPSTVICGDYVYIHPRENEMYKCSLTQLSQSHQSSSIWEKIAALPVNASSLVTANGHLLAVGGRDSKERKLTKEIYQYSASMTSWAVVSQMSTPRSVCLVAALPGNKLMVVGGFDTPKKCELASFV